MNECHIRHATAADLPAVVAIYNTSIPGRMATADTEPVTVAQREEWFNGPPGTSAAASPALLAHALAAAPAIGIANVLGFVFAHNHPSIKLFEAQGFQRWGLLPRVCELDGAERDVLILGRRL